MSPRASRERAGGARTFAALVLSGVLPLGCAAQGNARDTAEEFVAAVADGDGARACALLTPAAARKLEQSSGSRCARAVLDEQVPDEPIEHISVFETMAEARLRTQALFLARLDEGWRVQAAACIPVGGDRPYDCKIQGG